MKASPVTALGLLTLCFESACAQDALENDSNRTLKILYGCEPAAERIGGKAKSVLVFPNIARAGFIVGRPRGEGVLLKNGKPIAHYNSVVASYRFRAGARSFGCALFLMNDNALQYLDTKDGWEIGVGPSIVTVDRGTAKSLTTTTLNDDVYAFMFDQKGLRAGPGILGSKITKLEKLSRGRREQAAIRI